MNTVIYYHPDGGTIELAREARQIIITADGATAALHIGPLGCIELGEVLKAEGLAWLAADEGALSGEAAQ